MDRFEKRHRFFIAFNIVGTIACAIVLLFVMPQNEPKALVILVWLSANGLLIYRQMRSPPSKRFGFNAKTATRAFWLVFVGAMILMLIAAWLFKRAYEEPTIGAERFLSLIKTRRYQEAQKEICGVERLDVAEQHLTEQWQIIKTSSIVSWRLSASGRSERVHGRPTVPLTYEIFNSRGTSRYVKLFIAHGISGGSCIMEFSIQQ